MKKLKMLLIGISLLVVVFGGRMPAEAAVLTVTNLNDTGAGSLRDALNGAGNGDTILFDSSLTGGTIYLQTTLLVQDDVTIDGEIYDIKISGDSDNNGLPDVPVMVALSDFTLNNLTLMQGRSGVTCPIMSGTCGGGLYIPAVTVSISNTYIISNTANNGGGIAVNGGNLMIHNTVIAGNSASTSAGGGIFFYAAGGTLLIENSTIENNTAVSEGGGMEILLSNGTTIRDSTIAYNRVTNNNGGGGGIVTGNNSPMTIERSLVLGNEADVAGGMYIANASTTVLNSTFSGNKAISGAAIFSQTGPTTLIHTTVYNNEVLQVGGYALLAGLTSGALTTNHSIIAGTLGGGSNCNNNSSNGYNIADDDSCNLRQTGDQPLTDPKLAPLVDNEGATMTHHLLVGSPAIDTGDNTTCLFNDQRGKVRPVNGDGDFSIICDIGAYEVQPCGGIAPVLNNVEIGVVGANIVLSWDDTGSDWYEVWIATEPYLNLAMSGGLDPIITTNTSFTVTQGIGNQTNDFYFVRAVANCGQTSMAERFGDFNFDIVPGS